MARSSASAPSTSTSSAASASCGTASSASSVGPTSVGCGADFGFSDGCYHRGRCCIGGIDVVGSVKHLLVGGGCELEVRYGIADSCGEASSPDPEDDGGAAATLQGLGFQADVIQDSTTQL